MVSEPDTGRCANKEAELEGVDTRRCATKDAGLKRGGLGDSTSIGEGNNNWRREQVPANMLAPNGVDCEIPHRFRRRTKHSL